VHNNEETQCTAISRPWISGVTMGWLLRLVTGGGPTDGRGPPKILFYFKSEGRGPDLRQWRGAPDGCVTPLPWTNVFSSRRCTAWCREKRNIYCETVNVGISFVLRILQTKQQQQQQLLYGDYTGQPALVLFLFCFLLPFFGEIKQCIRRHLQLRTGGFCW